MTIIQNEGNTRHFATVRERAGGMQIKPNAEQAIHPLARARGSVRTRQWSSAFRA
jgi:hypothetical protein